nr:HAMP domain-containing sensor histidine kinase [Prevotella sp. UBA5379]
MERSLMNKMMTRFAISMVIILILTTPFLYELTTHFYAEDLVRIAKDYGIRPRTDLNKDVLVGLFIQFFGIMAAFAVTILLVLQFVPRRLWQPFRKTLSTISKFKVEEGPVTLPANTGVKEFDQLNATLNQILLTSAKSYRVQKEFTENASHELQTPLSIVLNKIDNLLQDEHLTAYQASEIQEMQQELLHMSRLSKNLLLLSKIENNQYKTLNHVNLTDKIESILPQLESLSGDIVIKKNFIQNDLDLQCNETLLVSMINNLVVNAVRHNCPEGSITITVADRQLSVSNTSAEAPLDGSRIFSRFYRTQKNQKGNGLGLAIVKSICDYHGWKVGYYYQDGQHVFTVVF